MKVKNEYIIIKNGKEQIKLHNMILNKYLDLIISNQLNCDSSRNDLEMNCCYLKFDDTIEVTADSIITREDFDLAFYYENMEINNLNVDISVIYNYNTIPARMKLYDISNQDFIAFLDDYIGRKITAIGFGPSYYNEDNELYACVDTNNYDLYLNDSWFSITRKDIFSTDGYFYCPSGFVKSPVHMFSKKPNETDEGPYFFAIPISVGLGLIPRAIVEEHTLQPYSEHLNIEDRMLKILDEIHVSYSDNGLYPADNLYPTIEIYPARRITEPLYPSLNIYPGEEIYPLSTPYIWYMFRYEVYEYSYNEIKDTGKSYYISVPINHLERIKSNIKYERA